MFLHQPPGGLPDVQAPYAALAPRDTTLIVDAGATVHNGYDFIPYMKLSDRMHFAEESTQAVVETYLDHGGPLSRQTAGLASRWTRGPRGRKKLNSREGVCAEE